MGKILVLGLDIILIFFRHLKGGVFVCLSYNFPSLPLSKTGGRHSYKSQKTVAETQL